MSNYFWKFTTLSEFSSSLSEDDNPQNPICLILNEKNETEALLAPKVSSNKISYVFSSKDNYKEFDSLEEAADFIGLDNQNPEHTSFLNEVSNFVEKETNKTFEEKLRISNERSREICRKNLGL